MSTHSSSTECPNCEGEMDTTFATKPYDHTYGECLNCGFQFYPQESYMTLDELNLQRADSDLPILEKLPDTTYEV